MSCHLLFLQQNDYYWYKNQTFSVYIIACKILIKIKLGRKKSRYIQQLTFDGYPCKYRFWFAGYSKLYISSYLNTDLIIWHTELIVYAVKC